MAGVLGFEPRYAGIKTLCLTAWRHPNGLRLTRAEELALFSSKSGLLSRA